LQSSIRILDAIALHFEPPGSKRRHRAIAGSEVVANREQPPVSSFHPSTKGQEVQRLREIDFA
jgi:hypothetical protein